MNPIRTIMVAAALAAAGTAQADVIFDTNQPQPGFIGYYGFDLYVDQSVAIAFTPDQDYVLDQVGLWMMSNDFGAAGATYRVSVRTDAQGGMTTPGTDEIESWDAATSAVGWDPVLDTFDSVLNPVLEAGTTYWIVAESTMGAGSNPVWVASSQDEPVWDSVRNAFNPGGDWISGYTQGAAGLIVTGSVVPAPGALAALGLAGIAGSRRRRTN